MGCSPVCEALAALTVRSMYPSLHIAFSFVAAGFISSVSKKLWWQIGVWVWFCHLFFDNPCTSASSVDLVTGLILGWACRKIV